MPAFGPALERALEAAGFAGPLGGSDLASAIESDLGLTVAVLRAGQRRSDAPVASVPDAVALLTPEKIRDTITSLPTVAFPWQTRFEALLLRCGSHAQTVARAADRIAQKLRPFGRDELVAGALLHDVGKLLLALMWPDFALSPAVRPHPRKRSARNAGSSDSTTPVWADCWLSDGGFLSPLVCAIAGHHSAYAPAEPATLIRLADMLVHHAHGDTVDRDVMLQLAGRCELSIDALRAVVGDLPHSGRSARRRAERSRAVESGDRHPEAPRRRQPRRGNRPGVPPFREHRAHPPPQHLRQAGGPGPRPGGSARDRDGLDLGPGANSRRPNPTRRGRGSRSGWSGLAASGRRTRRSCRPSWGGRC